MKNNERIMFAGKVQKEILDLANQLKENCNIETITRKYLDYYVLVARNDFDYRVGLIVGNVIITSLSYDIKYIDIKNNLNDSDNIYICDFYIKRYEEKKEELEKALSFFKEGLVSTLGVTVTDENYSFYSNHRFYIKITDIDISYYYKAVFCLNEILNKTINFVNEILGLEIYLKVKDFFKVEIFDITGECIKSKEQIEKEEISNLKTYFENSAIMLGISYPQGLNLSPKSDEKNNAQDEFYISSSSHYSEKIKGATLSRMNSIITINSEFLTHVKENYNFLNSSKQSSFKNLNFEMDDEVSVKSKVKIESDTKLVVISNVTVSRKVAGEKLCSVPTVYDALYKNTEYKNNTFSFEITDYYEIISTHILLHYTNSSKYYETYYIPFGFRFEDGLEKINNYSEIYDEYNEEWLCYNDILEVKEYFLG